MQINIPVTGPTYTNRSLDIGAQVTRNFYAEINPETHEPTSMMPFPGTTLFCAAAGGTNRGSGIFNNELYMVNGTNLIKVNSSGAATTIGTITGTGRCVMESDGNNLVITTGETKPYTYDGTTLTLGTDIDLHTSYTCAFINQRMVYDGDGPNILFADLNNPLSVASENVTPAESDPDDLVGVWAYRQQIFAAGTCTIQPYWNSGEGNPPYDPIINAVQQVGVHARYSATHNKDFSYFLGSDLNVYRYDGLSAQPIGNPAICQAISKYSDASDAFGVCFSFDSLNFYMLSFPTGNETWLYQEQSGQWTNLAYGTDGSQHVINSYQFVYNKHLVTDRRSGNVYELDFDTFTDNGDVIQRQRATIAISAKELQIGRPNSKLTMNWLRLFIEPGVSLVSAEAQIIMEYSDDHGKTWTSSLGFLSIGQQGDYENVVEWHQLGTFYSRMFRFTMTDPVKWVLIDAVADVEVGID